MKKLFFYVKERGAVKRGVLKSDLEAEKITPREKKFIDKWVIGDCESGEEILKIRNVFLGEDKKKYDLIGEFKRFIKDSDLEKIKEIKKIEAEARKFCQERLKFYGLKMKLIKVLSSFDEKRLIFYFSSPERVDFRALVRDLVVKFKRMIRLQQISPREQAEIISGFGPCGRCLCCATFGNDFARLNKSQIKEKEKKTRNSSKLLGLCGKPKCCLTYEKYGEKVKTDK